MCPVVLIHYYMSFIAFIYKNFQQQQNLERKVNSDNFIDLEVLHGGKVILHVKFI